MKKFPKGSLEKLHQDHKRMEIIFGTAIVILGLVFTGLVWHIPGIQVMPDDSTPTQPIQIHLTPGAK